MPVPQATLDYHTEQASHSASLYLSSQTPESNAADWREAIFEGRQIIAHALRSTAYFRSISDPLQSASCFTVVLRSLMAPPISQDQFKLVCRPWNKARENDNAALTEAVADAVSEAFEARRDRQLTRWLDGNRNPTRREVRELMRSVAPYIGLQRLGTARRNRLSRVQENSVVEFL